MIRRKGREIALHLLYQWEINRNSINKIIEDYKKYFEIPNEKAFEFAVELVKGITSHLKDIDNIIKKYTPSWPFERQNTTDRNILRIAVYEMFFRPDIPEIVSINEAIELAKIYGTDDSPAFVNGVLDSIYKKELCKKKSEKK